MDMSFEIDDPDDVIDLTDEKETNHSNNSDSLTGPECSLSLKSSDRDQIVKSFKAVYDALNNGDPICDKMIDKIDEGIKLLNNLPELSSDRESVIIDSVKESPNELAEESSNELAQESAGQSIAGIDEAINLTNNSPKFPADYGAVGQGPSNVTYTGPDKTPNGVEVLTTFHEKRAAMIQRQLVMIMHAYKCRRKEGKCDVFECDNTRRIIHHVDNCKAGDECPVSFCPSSKIVINHWKCCTFKYCTVCSPLKDKITLLS